MQCPQTTVFDQALGQCVFPFQLGQGGQTLSSYEGRNPQIPTSVTTTSIYPRPASTPGGIETTHYYQPNTLNPPNFAVQNGFYGQGGNSNTHSPEGGQPKFAVQTSFYGQEGSGGPGLHNNEVPNYAVQSTFYGQAPSATHTPSSNNNNNPNSDRPNYAVQNTFYGQMPGVNTQDNFNNQNEHATFLNQGNPQGPNYAVQSGPGYANFPQEIPDSYGTGSSGGGSTSDNGQTYFQLQPRPGYVPQNNVHYTNQYDHQNEHPSFLNQRNPQVRPQVYGNTDVQPSQQQPPAGAGGRQSGITIGITITNHGTSSVPYGTTAPPTTLVICLGRTGIFADRTSQCRSYTICRNDGVGETRTCPDNQVFNEQISACDNPQNTNCFFDSPGIVQPSVPVCLNGADRPNTFLPDVTQSCTTFYSCEQNGQGTQFRCPPGLQFNSKINACDDPRSCNCVAANGGTINIRIPVTTSQIIQSGEAYGPSYNADYQQDHGSNIATDTPNQNMNLDITVHRTKVGEYMPLVRGYDEALYADASVAFGRLPTFYSDDENGSAILNMTDMANDITPPTTTLSAQEQLRAASQQEHAALMQMAAAESVRLFAKTRPSITGVTNNSLVRAPDKPRSKFRELRLGRDPSKPFGGVLHALATANSRSMRRKFTR
ncbi:hypothetical protein RvY_01025 [Ramazzottius varieornatus]|uniref:Chitin-binding type-2 domain-containing protein n=1 Tax=Ramazzottius varieornatus TaxID=947166 RepID=A0A1D1UET7_RAMVA|nr:hypothetical protein RvY_01025 [Ramazzottius varieornatus]